MPRYIDLDKVIQDVESVGAYCSEAETVKELCLLEIKEQTIADVVPRAEVEKWYAEYHKVKEDLKQEKMYHRATEKLADRYLIELNQTKQEIEKLSIELEAMRGAANYKRNT